MTLKESIRFHTEEAEKMKLHRKVNEIILGTEGYERALQEHIQLAEWLSELQERRKHPEIIHCGECAFPYIRGKNMYCDQITGEEIMVWKDEYCSWAERRTDEK